MLFWGCSQRHTHKCQLSLSLVFFNWSPDGQANKQIRSLESVFSFCAVTLASKFVSCQTLKPSPEQIKALVHFLLWIFSSLFGVSHSGHLDTRVQDTSSLAIVQLQSQIVDPGKIFLGSWENTRYRVQLQCFGTFFG